RSARRCYEGGQGCPGREASRGCVEVESEDRIGPMSPVGLISPILTAETLTSEHSPLYTTSASPQATNPLSGVTRMLRTLRSIIGAVVVLAASAAVAQTPGSELFPLKKGSKWVYKV